MWRILPSDVVDGFVIAVYIMIPLLYLYIILTATLPLVWLIVAILGFCIFSYIAYKEIGKYIDYVKKGKG